MRVDIKFEGLTELKRCFAKMPDNALKPAVRELTSNVFESVRKRAAPHHDTGWMERNIYRDVFDSGKRGEVWIQNTPYAVFVHFGTKPHKITPKNKKALHWDNVFARSVDHPGYKGDPFMWLGAKDAMRKNLRKWKREKLC